MLNRALEGGSDIQHPNFNFLSIQISEIRVSRIPISKFRASASQFQIVFYPNLKLCSISFYILLNNSKAFLRQYSGCTVMLGGSGGFLPEENIGILYRSRRNFQHSRKHLRHISLLLFSHTELSKKNPGYMSGGGYTYPETC